MAFHSEFSQHMLKNLGKSGLYFPHAFMMTNVEPSLELRFQPERQFAGEIETPCLNG